ncbi:MAG: M20/M25/M40 family metallo-hydrolase [Candidatus Eisenbacteria bacterium]|nr:M20/M25/M40 family metallo-hydrolase [Candidatus Eisenbacteria bacterium]
MNERDLLALHRMLVSVRSVSGQEAALADLLQEQLTAEGLEVIRVEESLLVLDPSPALAAAPLFVLNSHLDTVPPNPAWTRDPWDATVDQGRVYGLGSNDAKASVAAMIAAFLRLRGATRGVRPALLLAREEETTNRGTAELLARLAALGARIEAAIVGEPTGLDLAVAQKGLMVLELRAQAPACHAANRQALGQANPIFDLARDLCALERFDLGEPHPSLGPITLEATVLSAGAARNAVPAEATCILDLRTNPTPTTSELLSALCGVVAGELVCRSDRFQPYALEAGSLLVQAAQAARPIARTYGSRTLSDLVHFRGLPALKAGPGDTRRSHTPDEFVLEAEILEGADFYHAAVLAYDRLRAEKGEPHAALGSP